MPRRDPIHPAEPLYDTHPSRASFADDVARYVQAFYTDHVLAVNKSARPGPNQWTVLAAIVVYTDEPPRGGHDGGSVSASSSTSPFVTQGLYRDEDITSYLANVRLARPHAARLEILTLATGVKCVGGSERSAEERAKLVIDMHAEVLARRELELLLLEQMREKLGQGVEDEEREQAVAVEETQEAKGGGGAPGGKSRRRRRTHASTTDADDSAIDLVLPPMPSADPIETIIELVSTSPPRFRLVPGKRLYLYTSHAPCGPAANAAHLARLDAEDQAMLGALDDRLNAAGVTHAPLAAASSDFRSIKSELRPVPAKKPSRADARPTTAYTCSDKLSRNQLLGLQGGRLSEMLERPIRLSGIVVGDDFDEPCLRMLFGGGDPGQYTRLEEGVREVLDVGGNGFDEEARQAAHAWAAPLPDRPSLEIYHSSVPFRFSRYGPNADRSIKIRDLPEGPDAVPRLLKISRLSIPLMRDELLARPTLNPSSLACSYRSGKYAEVLGPSGRVHGVGPHKRTKLWTDDAVSRVSRRSLEGAYQRLVGRHADEDAHVEATKTDEPLMNGDTDQSRTSNGTRNRSKGCKGWATLSSWMEQRGPFADWHKNGGRTPATVAAVPEASDTAKLAAPDLHALEVDESTATSSSAAKQSSMPISASSSSSATRVDSDAQEDVALSAEKSPSPTKPHPATLPPPPPPLKPRRAKRAESAMAIAPTPVGSPPKPTMTIKIGNKIVSGLSS